ncbi:hypothetical protein LX36DRAFT_325677 [Colletotrichum falcatum]|nr:hypothetical protein LX36DRAFT_325677 [Colletotrichum falcatum]
MPLAFTMPSTVSRLSTYHPLAKHPHNRSSWGRKDTRTMEPTSDAQGTTDVWMCCLFRIFGSMAYSLTDTTEPGAAESGAADSMSDDASQPPIQAQQPPPTARCGPSPWEMSFDRNRRQSRILGLPDELLLQIMKLVETSDLYMLRQVSFTFWRIYQGKDFSNFHRTDIFCRPYYYCSGGNGFENNETTVLRAKQHAFCAPCLQKMQSPDYKSSKASFSESMYCSQCKTNHKRIHFSAQQRYLPEDVRQCLGSYGFFRLCSHLVVSVRSIAKKAEEAYANNHSHEEIQLGSCSQCEHLAQLEENSGYKEWHVLPPKISLSESPEDENQVRFCIFFDWTLPFCKVGEGDSFTAGFLREKLEEFRNRYGDVFCPHFGLGQRQVLEAFGSESCHCLGAVRTDSRTGSLVHLRGPHHKTCDHHFSCEVCETFYLWSRDGGEVWFSKRATCEFDSKQDCITLLDPESYAASSDHETKHLFWCDDSECRNGRDWIENAKVLRNSIYLYL